LWEVRRSCSARRSPRCGGAPEADPAGGISFGIVEAIAFLSCYFALRGRLALGRLRLKGKS